MRTGRILCFARGLAAIFGCLSWALAATDKGAVLKPVLVELFTSEGCSSCPSADSLLASLDKSQPMSGVHIIVLSEHVDYWDSKSWTDPFSSPDVSLRQRAYDTRLKVDAPYTPEAIIDGRRECVGSDRSAIQAAILDAARAPKYDLRIVPGRKPQSIVIEADGPFPEAAEVFVAVAQDHAESKVAGGENRGRTLHHVAVLRSLRKIGKLGNHPQFRSEVSVSDLEAGRIVAFVQEKGVGRILGAAVYLRDPNRKP